MQNFVLSILETQSTYRQIIQRRMREHKVELSFEMIQIIKRLYKNDNINQQELANLTFKDKSSLSYLLKNLEKKNLIIRIDDESDKRNKIVQLTDEGKDIFDKLTNIVEDVYATIERETNPEQLDACIHYMKEFNQVVKTL